MRACVLSFVFVRLCCSCRRPSSSSSGFRRTQIRKLCEPSSKLCEPIRSARADPLFFTEQTKQEVDDGHFLPPPELHEERGASPRAGVDDADGAGAVRDANRGRHHRRAAAGGEADGGEERHPSAGGENAIDAACECAGAVDDRGGEGERALGRGGGRDGGGGDDENAADIPRGKAFGKEIHADIAEASTDESNFGTGVATARDDCEDGARDDERILHGGSAPITDGAAAIAEREYLYLNTPNDARRRANTVGSFETNSSSARQPTVSISESKKFAPSMLAASAPQDSHRIPNQCAICLRDYEKGDTIVTSCNRSCPHAFHRECIVEWLVRMQEGTPCPCCRRTFVELDEYNPRSGRRGAVYAAVAQNSNDGGARYPVEAERQQQEARRWSVESGIRRGRAFDISVINLRSHHNNANDTVLGDPREVDRRLRRSV